MKAESRRGGSPGGRGRKVRRCGVASEPRRSPDRSVRGRVALVSIVLRAVVACVAAAVASGPVSAHDLWIEPGDFTPAAETLLPVRLRVGEEFRGDPVARDPARIRRFTALGPAGERPIAGLPGSEPAGATRLDGPGLYVVVYETEPAPVELAAEAFEAYLAEEGLESVVERREKRGERTEPGRELYSRSAKALIRAAPKRSRQGAGTPIGMSAELDSGRATSPVGLPLELVPEVDPASLAGAGERELPLRLLFEGRPVAGALVVAMERSDPRATRVTARTDEEGRVIVPLDRSGAWLVKAVHMEAAGDADADWRSWWASLTFSL